MNKKTEQIDTSKQLKEPHKGTIKLLLISNPDEIDNMIY